MTRNWMRFLFVSLAVILLVGCSSIEDEVEDGIENAKLVFQSDAEKPNEKINNMKLFIPSGFSIEDEPDETNIILSKGKDSYILFLNPNELPGSRLYYDLMMADTNLNIVEEKTFEQNGRFGFVAILENSEEKYELITSIGGIKLSTISKQQDIAGNLEKMMTIVRSITTN
ncbi:hypothetical protein [Psychrobacillus lasiicapitis]|uniref:Uncharacterized protein n=1 Tax=Psychrobacillus lasiicapitis TaxID=1636719 RepID=A0A544T980_9BACI|nr:hypothetical protein [Psychrobacillus lasiicapitis]TQR13995.1 hypothetical protein FG382_10350 [Psychrobacillus lasiicapitis]GGA37275.1 hypothetical protein GCM10011384_28640 [Psychrobacillus lasiicapitis]